MKILIFSKDRPLQLEALLESLFLHCKDITHPKYFPNITVLYTVSSVKYDYSKIMARYPVVKFLQETNFTDNVLSELDSHSNVLFLVDDTIFVKDFTLSNMEAVLKNESISGISLRLGLNTSYSYATNSNQTIPNVFDVGHGMVAFNWRNASGDFNYPFELSSSLYRVSTLNEVLQTRNFSNPNTLEYLLTGLMKSTQTIYLVMYRLSAAFSAPLNSVQNNNWLNRFSELKEHAADILNELYMNNKRIDVVKVANKLQLSSCHQEFTVSEYLKPAHIDWKDGMGEFHSEYYDLITKVRLDRLKTIMPSILDGIFQSKYRNHMLSHDPYSEVKLDQPKGTLSCIELGAGYDVFTNYLLSTRKLNVDIHDGRKEIVEAVEKKYPYVKGYTADLNNVFDNNKRYDLVMAYGILYHLADISNFILTCKQMAGDNGVVVIDFAANGKTDDSVESFSEPLWLTQALDSRGNRPSKLNVVNRFSKHFPYIYDFEPPAHTEYQNGARAEFIASKIPLTGFTLLKKWNDQ